MWRENNENPVEIDWDGYVSRVLIPPCREQWYFVKSSFLSVVCGVVAEKFLFFLARDCCFAFTSLQSKVAVQTKSSFRNPASNSVLPQKFRAKRITSWDSCTKKFFARDAVWYTPEWHANEFTGLRVMFRILIIVITILYYYCYTVSRDNSSATPFQTAFAHEKDALPEVITERQRFRFKTAEIDGSVKRENNAGSRAQNAFMICMLCVHLIHLVHLFFPKINEKVPEN